MKYLLFAGSGTLAAALALAAQGVWLSGHRTWVDPIPPGAHASPQSVLRELHWLEQEFIRNNGRAASGDELPWNWESRWLPANYAFLAESTGSYYTIRAKPQGDDKAKLRSLFIEPSGVVLEDPSPAAP